MVTEDCLYPTTDALAALRHERPGLSSALRVAADITTSVSCLGFGDAIWIDLRDEVPLTSGVVLHWWDVDVVVPEVGDMMVKPVTEPAYAVDDPQDAIEGVCRAVSMPLSA